MPAPSVIVVTTHTQIHRLAIDFTGNYVAGFDDSTAEIAGGIVCVNQRNHSAYDARRSLNTSSLQ